MTVCLHKKLIGTDLHLVSEGDEFRWTREVPKNAWLCGFSDDHPLSIDALSSATDREIQTLPSEAYSTMWNTLREKGSDSVPWHYALGGARFQAHLKQLLYKIQRLLEVYCDSYYTNEFVTIRRFLQGLVRCRVDSQAVTKILSDKSQRSGSLSSFLPEGDGLLSRPVYSQVASCSGRLTVTKGPSILTLRKDRRSLLRSSKKDGTIVQIDFVSLEPRVALSVAGHESPADIYEDIRENVLGGCVSRKVAKIATISSLYGMSARKLSEMVGLKSESEAREVLKKIRGHFQIRCLERELNKSVISDGFIKSHYGRIMNIDDSSNHILVNRFIQSTATDAALLGFQKLVDEIQNNGISADPVFVIHDALIFDVEKYDLEKLSQFVKNPISLPGLSGDFPIALEIIS